MDKKELAQDAYVPDKKGQKDKVVICLSGGMNSYVMAYLLKIQKYELMGVTVINQWEEYSGESSKILSCHINQSKLDEIKSFCNKMGIPHKVVREPGQFKEKVIEEWIASKILGRLSNQCWSCHDLRMELLFQTMKELGAKHLATGHLAKLFHNETSGSVFVHTANDEDQDQSALLSRLPHDILNSLILPLSDLTRKEVLKLAENFGVSDQKSGLLIHECFSWDEALEEAFKKKVPERFYESGEISNTENSEHYGQHDGVYHHSLGEEIATSERSARKIFTEYSYAEKKIFVSDEKALFKKNISLVECNFSEEVSWLEPLKGFVKLQDHSFLECWIYPKTLSSVYIELAQNHKFLSGEIISVLRKKGKNSKVYLSGKVDIRSLESHDEEETQEGTAKVDYRVDF